jgi:hypothetical protein
MKAHVSVKPGMVVRVTHPETGKETYWLVNPDGGFSFIKTEGK